MSSESRALPAALALLLAAGLMALGQPRSPIVVIRNLSDAPLERLELSGHGFSETLPRVEPGASALLRVIPERGSGLRVAFAAGDAAFEVTARDWLPPQRGYGVVVEIAPDFAIAVRKRGPAKR